MASTTDKNQKSIQEGPTEKEWKDTQSVLTSFLRAWKNYSLYPETHVNCEASLQNFFKQIETYLSTYDRLRFEFIKGQLLFKGKAILSEPREEGNLTYNLFRDGIQWLQFQKGLESIELKVFLNILNKYRILADEPDGDLVTALWSNSFDHIQYHVADLFWGVEPEIEFSANPSAKVKAALSPHSDAKGSKEFESIVPLDAESMVITHREYEELAQVVSLEEKRDPTPDFLDVMIDCLLQHKEKENFDSILEALEKEFYDSIARNDFNITHRILKSLRYVIGYAASGTPWVQQAIDKFFVSVSSAKSLQSLQASWDGMDDKQLAKVKESFLLFHPGAIETLGMMLLQTSSYKIQQMLTGVILSLASRDYKPIEALLNRPEEELIRKLVKVLGQIKGEGPAKAIYKMVHHSSAIVRQEAVNCLLKQDAKNIQKLYKLIDDESEIISRTILNYMGQEKNSASEDFLINYLRHGKFKSSQEAHIIRCYNALGQCRSQRSILFLKETLNSRGGVKDLLKLTDRKGAAMALKAIGSEEAIEVLEAASKSLYPNIRYITRQVMKGQDIIKEQPLDR